MGSKAEGKYECFYGPGTRELIRWCDGEENRLVNEKCEHFHENLLTKTLILYSRNHLFLNSSLVL